MLPISDDIASIWSLQPPENPGKNHTPHFETERYRNPAKFVMGTLSIQSRIRRIQRHLGIEDDGLVGPVTLSRLEEVLGIGHGAANLIVSFRGVEMLIAFEISSPSYYRRELSKPHWPGGASGVTIGIGYDLGYNTIAQVEKDWKGKLSDATLQELLGVTGLRGIDAREASIRLRELEIVIPLEMARSVFFRNTLPRYARQTRKAYPGIEALPHDAQAALLSLVYNRGTSKSGARRREMKAIEKEVRNRSLSGIAGQIRAMKRLWIGKGLPGLLTRRDKEAELVENSERVYLEEELIYL